MVFIQNMKCCEAGEIGFQFPSLDCDNQQTQILALC